MAHLFTPAKLGAYSLSHRVVLAPMTLTAAQSKIACASCAKWSKR